MYRSDLNNRNKSGAIAAVVAVHAALLFVLLHISGPMNASTADSVLRVFDVRDVPPPPPEIVQPPKPEPQPKPKPKESEGAASPPNVKSHAADIEAPPISLPVPVPMKTSTTPNSGTEATQGAAYPGPGTGADGAGTGTGGGGSGNGTGGGGAGGYVVPPRLLTPVLRGRDFARQLLESWPRGAQVFLRIRVSPAGTVSQCIVDRGTGVEAIDSTVCAMVEQRFRYSPALDRSGQAVAGWAGYRQVPPR